MNVTVVVVGFCSAGVTTSHDYLMNLRSRLGAPLWLWRKWTLPGRVRRPVPGLAGILSNAEETFQPMRHKRPTGEFMPSVHNRL